MAKRLRSLGVLFALPAVVVVVLWIRSYGRADYPDLTIPPRVSLAVYSWRGTVRFSFALCMSPQPLAFVWQLQVDGSQDRGFHGFNLDRNFQNGIGWFGITVPHGFLLTLSIIPPVLIYRRARRTAKDPDPHACPTCGYDLRATPTRCPECGTPNPPPP